MNDAILTQIRDLIQEDVGRRGLATDPERNLINAFPDDFAKACRSIATHQRPAVAIVTGFFIPDSQPPAGETDGPLGALFLARVFASLRIPVALITDQFCRSALAAGLAECKLGDTVELVTLPENPDDWGQFIPEGWIRFARTRFGLTHLIAIERPGPSHSFHSLLDQKLNGIGIANDISNSTVAQELPLDRQDRYHTMSGKDITDLVGPAHLLFDTIAQMGPFGITTIGIGDGGNEIGMGKLPWDVIRRNIPRGGLIACRVPVDHLIVCGISNWGAYGLAAGVTLLHGQRWNSELNSLEKERALLELMVKRGPLVDGVTKVPAVSVDGLPFDRYVQPLQSIMRLMEMEEFKRE